MYKRQTFSSHRCIKYTATTALCRRISIIFRHMRINITNGSQGEPNITFNFFRLQSHEGSCLLLVYFPRRKEGYGIRRRIHLLVPFWKCPYKKWNAKVSARAWLIELDLAPRVMFSVIRVNFWTFTIRSQNIQVNFPHNLKNKLSESYHMCPLGACKETWLVYWKAGCCFENTGSFPIIPLPLTVSSVPKHLKYPF